MPKSKSRIPSPSKSQGAPIVPHRRTRRTLSVGSQARSDASGRLTSVVGQYLKNEKYTVSPMTRRSVLPDDTDIEMPRRASWWKRLEGSSRDVLEALDTNQMPADLLEDYEFEVPLEKQTVQTLPENSDNDSVASIVVPQRRLFNQKRQTREKFGEIAESRKSLGRTLLDDQDQTIKEMPKSLFSKGQPRNRPVFPAALLNSTNKTINKTVEPELNNHGRNLFGQAGTKRKNMFTDFVLSESEDDSLVQHKVFAFKKDTKRMSLASRNRRMPSLTPSVTTDIDIDDWNLLPSSTMIGNGSGAIDGSRIITDADIEQAQAEDQDVTLTEANGSLKSEAEILNTSNKSRKSKSLNRTRLGKSRKLDDDFDKTLTNENIETEQAIDAEKPEENKSLFHNETVLSETLKDKTMETETSKHESVANDQALEKDQNIRAINSQTTENELSIEDKMAELHKESEDKNEPSIEDEMAELHEESGEKSEPSIDDKMAELHEEIEDNSEDQVEPSVEPDSEKEITLDEKIEEPESSKDISNDEDEDTDGPESSKEITNGGEDDTKEPESSEEITNNNDQDEEMEPMVWSDNDAEKASEHDVNEARDEEENDEEVVDKNGGNNEEQVSTDTTPVKGIPDKSQNIVELVSAHTTSVKGISDKSQKIVESPEEEGEQQDDVVDETPNSSYDSAGRNRKKRETKLKSPETVLKDTSKDDISFKPMGRSTSFRKSKSVVEDINTRPTLIPIQESTIASEGSRNSSTEGSGWDSHRTTRQTLRQTFGKDFTPRKSLRALVMEQSAKRQAEVHRNASKLNKTKNKTVSEDAADHNIRDRRVSANLSSDQLPDLKSPVPDVSTHHVADPLISKPELSYHKSVHDIDEQTITNREKSVNIQVVNDSGPEISIDVSYGEGMSREASERVNDRTADKTKHHEKSHPKIPVKEDSVPMETEEVMQEELDYDPSVQDSIHDVSVAEMSEKEKSQALSENEEHDNPVQDLSDHDDEEEKEESEQEIEADDSEQEEQQEESEQELEDEESQQNIQQESDQEMEHEESQQEIEVESEQEENETSQEDIEVQSDKEENEMSQQEIDVESEQEENEMSQQDIEVESGQEENETSQEDIEVQSDKEENEMSQQEIEVESEEEENEMSQQDIEVESEQEENEMSQQEIEVESVEEERENSEHEVEPDTERESENEKSQQASEQESDGDVSDVPAIEQDSDNEQNDRSERLTERIVFDNEMSDQEIDYEVSNRISKQITEDEDDEVSEQVSDQEAGELDESIASKRSKQLIELKRIAQKNWEIRQKIREQVTSSLKQTRINQFMPMQSNFPVRRITKPQPKKPKLQPRKTTMAIGTLPKQFVEDLKYKPPKRYQPPSASWITKHLYKFLETKLEPKYDYRARVRAEELVRTIHSFTKLVRRHKLAPQSAVDELKKEMARLHIVQTHFEFYDFFHEFMPREIRVKVNPDIVNRIPAPRNGIFGDILQSSTDAV